MNCKYFNYISTELWATHMIVLNTMTPEEQKEYLKVLDEQFEQSLMLNDNSSSSESPTSSPPTKLSYSEFVESDDKKLFSASSETYNQLSVKRKIDLIVASSPPGHQAVLMKEDFTDAELREMNRLYFQNMYNK